MFFAVLTFLAAFSIEAIGTVVSVIGLSTLFGANPIIIALAVSLDVGKLLVVSLLYTHWKKLNFLMKSYALIAAAVTMTITSAGAAGYLSGEFQKAIMGTQEVSLKVDILKEEQAKLEARKQQIDLQIANLPSNYSRSRITLMKEFSDEQAQITARLGQISKDLPELQIAQIGVEAKAGPILYISKAFDIPVEEAVKWVILMIIFVFDPLAVFLIVAGNFLLHLRRTHTDSAISDADLFEDARVEHNVKIAREVETEFPEPAVYPEMPAHVSDGSSVPAVVTLTNDPDTSQTKVYTRDDLIAQGVSDAMLIEAGYEPRAPIVDDGAAVKTHDLAFNPEARAPIFEVLEPTPVKAPEVDEPSEITLSSLTKVKADPSTATGDDRQPRQNPITSAAYTKK